VIRKEPSKIGAIVATTIAWSALNRDAQLQEDVYGHDKESQKAENVTGS